MNNKRLVCLATLIVGFSILISAPANAGFRVKPYLLPSETGSVTVVWFSNAGQPGTLRLNLPDGPVTFTAPAVTAPALGYHQAELEKLPDGKITTPPYKHTVRLTGLTPGAGFDYQVKQGTDVYDNTLSAAPAYDSDVSFVVFADCETEPESTGKPTGWPEPNGDKSRKYVVDQTEGFKQNLLIIQSRQPGFLAFAGDITESGGEQRDWDELWHHLAGDIGTIGGSVPLVAAPGNHDAYGGPGELGRFEPEAHLRAMYKYRTYFSPSNNADKWKQDYFRIDYGPITLISLDSTNGLPERSERDTNWILTGRNKDHDFNPGSVQYQWLEQQLAEAQKRSAFTFVQFHHVPYSVGPHGFVPGEAGHAHAEDNQSGQPMQALTDLFMRYGVDAVFAGHDEMYEHSMITDGVEQLPGDGGASRPHKLHIYDVGIAGDGLRGPYMGRDTDHADHENPYQIYLAHWDAPEVWEGKRLISGGKHYGHLEVNVNRGDNGHWQAVLTPAYSFPIMNDQGDVTGWERRVYNDVVILKAQPVKP